MSQEVKKMNKEQVYDKFDNQLQIINSAHDEIVKLKPHLTESEIQFEDDIYKAIAEYITREFT